MYPKETRLFLKKDHVELKVYNGIEAFQNVDNLVMTIGTFDGVHSGHQAIFSRLKDLASQINGETMVLTFFPHPRMVLYPDDNALRLLHTIEERKQLLEEAGIDHLVIHPFSKQFARLTSLDFVRDVLVTRLGVSKLIIGYDHHFGRNREGSIENLQELAPLYGFEVEEIPAQEMDQVNISSTKVRQSLIDGAIGVANNFLGYAYFFHGKVVKGDQIGRTIGFPTANIAVEHWYKLIPKQGVYAVNVQLHGSVHRAMLNIGTRPTVDGDQQTLEVHIFDFDADIYGETLKVELYHRIRDEKKFEELSDLKKQLILDKEKSIQLLDC